MVDLKDSSDTLTAEQTEAVRTRTRELIATAAELYSKKFPMVNVRFNLRGASAGQFRVSQDGCEIRYNPAIFCRYFVENHTTTIAHEVAHYLVYMLYPLRRRGRWKVKPHGSQWQAIMADLGADASVCHNFDLGDIPRRKERRFSYHCECQQHQVSCRRHNKIQSQQGRYVCRYCHTELRPGG